MIIGKTSKETVLICTINNISVTIWRNNRTGFYYIEYMMDGMYKQLERKTLKDVMQSLDRIKTITQ